MRTCALGSAQTLQIWPSFVAPNAGATLSRSEKFRPEAKIGPFFQEHGQSFSATRVALEHELTDARQRLGFRKLPCRLGGDIKAW